VGDGGIIVTLTLKGWHLDSRFLKIGSLVLDLQFSIEEAILLQETMSSLAEKFLHRQQSKATQRTYRQDVMGFLQRFNWMDATSGEFLELDNRLMADRAEGYLETFKIEDAITGQVRNARTINRRRYALSAFFRFLCEQISLPKNPITSLPRLRVSKWSNTPTLSLKEIIIFFYHMEKGCEKSESSYRDYLALLSLFHLALRLNEVACLRWSQIDENWESVTVQQKGGREKTVPLPPQLKNYFLLFKERFGQFSDFIFHPVRNNRTKTLDKPISGAHLYRIVKKEAALVFPGKPIHPHSFRASFVTISLESGEDLIRVMNATGHANLDMVRYYDRRNRLKSNSINALAKWI